jgi:hypothetical protein
MGVNLTEEPIYTTLEPEDYFKKYPKRIPVPLWLKRSLIKAVDSICERCDEYFPFPQIHHVDGDPKNNVHENLMVVCPNCHVILDMEIHYRYQ